MNRVTFTRPPQTLRRTRPDNLALIPASLLPFKAVYQQLANDLPIGSTPIVITEAFTKSGQILGNLATQLEAKGHQVKVIRATHLGLNL